MTRTTILTPLLATLLTATLGAAPAAANPLGQLFQYTGQIRAQMAAVRAQTDATFASCPRGALIADDIYDELEDLCRDLDRLEEQISRPVASRRQLRRLERLVRELDEQACEVHDAVHEAIEDRRFLGAPLIAPQPQAFGIPGVPDHVVRRLPPHVVTRLVSIHSARANRGVNVSVNRGRFNLAIGAQPIGLQRTAFRPIGLVQGAGPSPAAQALCSQAETLRTMTRQLLAIVCG